MKTAPLWFIKNGKVVHIDHVAPDRTLLDLLREDLGHKGTKEGCAQGDCGACAVVISRTNGNDISLHAINSCIRFAHSIHGLALFTVEDLQQPNGDLHPCQQAMVDQHGSQCGFCTPGFVMSMFAMYERYVPSGQAITRHTAQHELSGNLCRCTGYRPIFDAASAMANYPKALIDRQQLKDTIDKARQEFPSGLPGPQDHTFYAHPEKLDTLLAIVDQHPDAQLVAGGTDVGLWVTKQHRTMNKIIDLSRVKELLAINKSNGALVLGAAAPLSQAFTELDQQFPGNTEFFQRYAGLLVRESATLGGNIANGSPIGDSMPLLIALGANVILRSINGERQLPVEDFYLGYRQTVLAPNEVIQGVSVPITTPPFLRAYKLSKRQDDDISIACLVIAMRVENDRISHVRIGVGGMAAVPKRAVRTEAFLLDQIWQKETMDQAAEILQAEFEPISDMRASSDYRKKAMASLIKRFWLEYQP
jgi:xanthine dehydrogenase small subunit